MAPPPPRFPAGRAPQQGLCTEHTCCMPPVVAVQNITPCLGSGTTDAMLLVGDFLKLFYYAGQLRSPRLHLCNTAVGQLGRQMAYGVSCVSICMVCTHCCSVYARAPAQLPALYVCYRASLAVWQRVVLDGLHSCW
jgi:hypothetical protein